MTNRNEAAALSMFGGARLIARNDNYGRVVNTVAALARPM